MIKEKVKLLSKNIICDGIIEFEFEKPKNFEFKVGQYVNLYISGAEVAHGKSYTIISTPYDQNLKFSIRKRGPFSTYIHNLNIGEEMIIEGPEGYFSFEEYKDGLIFIGAGIGVAPLIAYLRYVRNQKTFLDETRDKQIRNPKIKVLVTNKTESSTPYLNELEKLDTKFFYTGNGGSRIDVKSVEEIIKNNNLPIFICGSINFTNDYWKILRNLNIPDDRIITEAFF